MIQPRAAGVSDWQPRRRHAAQHTATLLPSMARCWWPEDSGSSGSLSSAELYDPASGLWTPTGSLATGRYAHTATLLANGKVLVAGGYGSNYLSSAELYEPAMVPVVQSAVSRKTHGAAGPFDIALPLTGTPGIECRSGGGTSDYTVVVTFASNVTVAGNPQAQVISGTGCVGNGGTCTGSASVSGATVTVPLTNIGNAQTISLKLFGVSSGEESADIDLAMSILAGDTNADGAVNSGDTLQTRNRSGQATDATNFRSDVNLDGFVNSGDTLFVRTRAGTSLP